jgi:general secretion pathway protein H
MDIRAQRAFTLIEVMVVVVIVGIISAVVLLSTGLLENDRDMQEEARRISTLIELASDEALLQSRDFGVEFTQNGYRFVEFDPFQEQWYEIAGDEILRPRTLGDGLRFELFIEDRRVLLNAELATLGGDEKEAYDRRKANYAPHTLILSSGQLSPFKVLLIRDRDRLERMIEVTPQGTVEVDDGADDAS